jgi:hypothetical protein
MPPHRTRRRCYIAPSAAPRDSPLAVSSFSTRCQCAVAPDDDPLALGCPGNRLSVHWSHAGQPAGAVVAGPRGGCGWPRPPRAGPPGRGPILQWTTIARQGPRLMPVGELGGNQPPGDCPSPASAGDFRLSGMKLGPSPEATSSHHQDPEGDTTLTRPWPVVDARGGLRAKAGLSLHRVSAVRRNGFQK